MNLYEQLEDEACKDGIDVIDYEFNSDKIKGLYCNGTVAIHQNIKTSTKKACVLSEELGHHYTTTGNILDQSVTENRKQEYRARLWAYNKMIGLQGIITAYEHSCRSLHEMADYLNVTEAFLLDTINCYKNKYGLYTIVDNYVIYFEPTLSVGKLTAD